MLIASLSLVAFPAELFGKLLLWEQLPNSGDALKLLIPNCSIIRKAISGRSNDPCKVISQKMIEREIGNRGSKSVVFENTIVKEQRVDGDRHKYFISMSKVYSNGFRKKLSSQTPFISNNKLIGFVGYSNNNYLGLSFLFSLISLLI
jgi:hypothetical protein